VRAYVRISDVEHELHGPLATTLGSVADHLGGRARETFERIARIDRERAPGTHVFAHAEFVELVGAAHQLLCDPPMIVRRTRRVFAGALPAAERVGALLVWLRAHSRSHADEVVYDLWRSQVSST
jgi:hypothetical protein